MGDVLSEQPTDELAVAAAKKVPTLVVLSSERTRGLIEQEQMMRAVGRMSVVGLETLSGAKHFLRREDQRNLARHVVGFARRRRVIL